MSNVSSLNQPPPLSPFPPTTPQPSKSPKSQCPHINAPEDSSSSTTTTRRTWMRQSLVWGLFTTTTTLATKATSATAAAATPPDSSFLSLDELARQLTHDLTVGATNQGSYLLTGDLNPALFQDDCQFIDPTTRVTSVQRYQQAFRHLFDAKRSTVEVLTPLVVDPDSHTISTTFRSRGFLQLPWNPYITAYEST